MKNRANRATTVGGGDSGESKGKTAIRVLIREYCRILGAFFKGRGKFLSPPNGNEKNGWNGKKRPKRVLDDEEKENAGSSDNGDFSD